MGGSPLRNFMQTRWIYRLSILYLTLPFILFLFGWVRLTISIPIALVLLFALYKLLITNHQSPITNYFFPLSSFLFHCLLDTTHLLLALPLRHRRLRLPKLGP